MNCPWCGKRVRDGDFVWKICSVLRADGAFVGDVGRESWLCHECWELARNGLVRTLREREVHNALVGDMIRRRLVRLRKVWDSAKLDVEGNRLRELWTVRGVPVEVVEEAIRDSGT